MALLFLRINQSVLHKNPLIPRNKNIPRITQPNEPIPLFNKNDKAAFTIIAEITIILPALRGEREISFTASFVKAEILLRLVYNDKEIFLVLKSLKFEEQSEKRSGSA